MMLASGELDVASIGGLDSQLRAPDLADCGETRGCSQYDVAHAWGADSQRQ